MEKQSAQRFPNRKTRTLRFILAFYVSMLLVIGLQYTNGNLHVFYFVVLEVSCALQIISTGGQYFQFRGHPILSYDGKKVSVTIVRPLERRSLNQAFETFEPMEISDFQVFDSWFGWREYYQINIVSAGESFQFTIPSTAVYPDDRAKLCKLLKHWADS